MALRSNADDLEEKVKSRAIPLLQDGRPGDLEHTFRVVELGRTLAEAENGDMLFIIPALYLHDIGWSQIDYSEWQSTPYHQQEQSEPALKHQLEGAKLADRILRQIKLDKALTARIVKYIEVHDQPAKVFSLNDSDATLCFEADRLDRFGKDGKERFDSIFGGYRLEERADFLKSGMAKWFCSETALRILNERMEAMLE